MERSEDSQLAVGVRSPVRRNLTVSLVAGALAAGAALRLWMLHALFEVNGDSLVYGGIAKNLLLHQRYALTTAKGITYGTLIRLPGYPLFLAVCFKLFGVENYFAVGCVQILVELAGCVLLAAFARRIAERVRPADFDFGRRAGLATLWLAVLCPFTASYAGRSMAETLSLFGLTLAMYSMCRFSDRPDWKSALAFTFAATYATLLRPDGALAAVAFAPAILMAVGRGDGGVELVRRVRLTAVCILLALVPFAVWTWRNERVFHVFQPLAPRLAIDPDERANLGWESWVKSWCLDFVSTYEVYWNVPGDTLNVNALPIRAFDSPSQRTETVALANDYNAGGKALTADLDRRFAHLAEERVAEHPLRYHLWLPVARMVDMWVRPRTEELPVDLHWWEYSRHHRETIFAWSYAALNAAYLLLALAGLWLRPRYWKALTAYLFLRCALLLTVQAPEARYTLECFPMIFALGGSALAAISAPKSARPNRQRA